MSKTSFTKILLFFFLLVGLEKINASSSTNLRKRKATTTTTSFINALSSILMKEDWDCCDGTNEPTAVVTSTPTTLRPTSIPTASPTYMETKLTASDGTEFDYFGGSCSMSDDLIVIGALESAVYLYKPNGSEIKKLTAGDDADDYDYFGDSVSVDEKVVVGAYISNYVQVFSVEGKYERSITCDDCYIFGRAVATNGDRVVTSGYDDSSWYLYIYTTEGQLLKTTDNGDDYFFDVDISDEAIVGSTWLKTYVYSNSDADFEKIAEIPQAGRAVATSGDRVVIANYRANNYAGAAWLYKTDGTFIRTLEHDSQRFGSSVDITDDNIIVGAYGDDEVADLAGAVFIYSAATGDFQEKVLAPDGEADDYFGSCVSATDSHLVVGATGEDDNGERSGAAYMFPFSD